MQSEAATSPSDAVELYRLLEATRALERSRSDRFDRYLPVFRALKAAGRRGLAQVQLASSLGITPARMSRLIDFLEPQGLITRGDHPLDRRVKVIQLTELGQDHLANSEAELQDRCSRAFDRLSLDEIMSLKRILARLVPQAARMAR
jgi:DNA-binding MarR family transcriptional regulator